MKNLTVAAIGFFAGAAVGGTSAWLITKNIMQKRNDEELSEAHARYREKLKEAGVPSEEVPEKETEESSEEDDEESHRETPEDKIDKNRGVKRYWKPVDKNSLDNEYSKAVDEIKKEGKDVTENERAAELDPTTDEVPGISIISEDEYISDQGFEKVSLQYFCGDDALQMLNPDGTTGENADKWFRMEKNADIREEVIGKYLRWAPDYIEPGNSNGYLYIRNDNLKMEFEIDVIDDFFMNDDDVKIGPDGDIKENE